ncbi:hypothetical protein Barb6_02052 [Bacteroidales bacterium Barb6]|nr:hypothetical protein Barb6_02052 [Bacteroidales bacterium Barb6]
MFLYDGYRLGFVRHRTAGLGITAILDGTVHIAAAVLRLFFGDITVVCIILEGRCGRIAVQILLRLRNGVSKIFF